MKQSDEKSSESRMLEIGTYGSMRGGEKTVIGFTPLIPYLLCLLYLEPVPVTLDPLFKLV
jgi:hypothetical protein